MRIQPTVSFYKGDVSLRAQRKRRRDVRDDSCLVLAALEMRVGEEEEHFRQLRGRGG